MNSSLETIVWKIEKGEPISPFLFLWPNLELCNNETYTLANTLLEKYGIDKNSLFVLSDTEGESIKIEETRNFIAKGYEKPRFKFQIFLVENISRMTLQSANACLKFFEEPWVGNIILLTNASEAGVLDTILSRVRIVKSNTSSLDNIQTNYLSMIQSYYESGDIDLVSYLYKQKLEKSDYKDFLTTLLHYIMSSGKCSEKLDELEKDIQGLAQNNLSGKYIVDKYL